MGVVLLQALPDTICPTLTITLNGPASIYVQTALSSHCPGTSVWKGGSCSKAASPIALRASSRSTGRSTQASGRVACILRRMCTSAATAPSYRSLPHLHCRSGFTFWNALQPDAHTQHPVAALQERPTQRLYGEQP